ncbi:MAG: protein phosphatase CheZ [Betaproteobacteria bacterium]|nr:protein phosphatase CheZ [Betaproteobacteria bacterium]
MSGDNKSGDSDELEALFDSIASSGNLPAAPAAAPPAPVPAPASPGGTNNDSDELQALFDSVVDEYGLFSPAAKTAPPPSGTSALSAGGAPLREDDGWQGKDKVFHRVGTMARQLHDTLCELGYDKLVEDTVAALPDAKDRLAYIANLTEQAACRVLNATDIANPLQDKLENDALALGAKWDALFANRMGVDEFKHLAAETRAFLKHGLHKETGATKAQLLEIMMAQDFQDLTGQVIKKVIGVAQQLESQLMGVLIETIPGECRTESVNSLLNGPVINAEGRADVVASQEQVDDLLDSLGF